MSKRSKPPGTHTSPTDAEAYDLLAAWVRRGPEGERDVERCWAHDDGTWEVVLRHEPHDVEGFAEPQSRARSVTQRTLSSAIRSALGIARAQGAA